MNNTCAAAGFTTLAEASAARRGVLIAWHMRARATICKDCGIYHLEVHPRWLHLSRVKVAVLHLLALGHTAEEIAKEIKISTYTVRKYIDELIRAFGALNTTNLISMAIALKVIDARVLLPPFRVRSESGSTESEELHGEAVQSEGAQRLRHGDGEYFRGASQAGEGSITGAADRLCASG